MNGQLKLRDYILDDCKTYTAAAERHGVTRSTLNAWVKKSAIVIDGTIYVKAAVKK